jgi:hypothetical protein
MMMNRKGFGRKRSWPNFKELSRHSLGEVRKPQKSSIRIAGRHCRDLKPEPPKYEARVLTARPRRSVKDKLKIHEV